MKELKKKIKEDKKALEKATKEADKAKMQCEEERRLFEERQIEEMIKGQKGKDREKLEKGQSSEHWDRSQHVDVIAHAHVQTDLGMRD